MRRLSGVTVLLVLIADAAPHLVRINIAEREKTNLSIRRLRNQTNVFIK